MTEDETVVGETVIPDENANSEKGVTPTAEELLAKQQAKFDEEKGGMEAQIIDLRTALQLARSASGLAETSEEKNKADKAVDEVEEKIRKVLSEGNNKKAEDNRKSALTKLWTTHKELHPENDITGVKMDVFWASYKRLNTSDSVSEEEILKNFEDAYKLMSDLPQKTTNEDLNEIASTSAVSGSPKSTVGIKLSSKEEELRKERGWTVEKFLSVKAKHPWLRDLLEK